MDCSYSSISSYSGICGLSFAKKGQLLCVVGHDGKAYEINSETGELLKEFRVSKKSISSLAFSHGVY